MVPMIAQSSKTKVNDVLNNPRLDIPIQKNSLSIPRYYKEILADHLHRFVKSAKEMAFMDWGKVAVFIRRIVQNTAR